MATKVTLQSCNGFLLTAEDGGGPQGTTVGGRSAGLITCREPAADGPGPWEEFELVQIDADHYALKSHLGFYVCAESVDGQVVEVVANRTEIGAWETWQLRRNEGDFITIQAHNGKFLSIQSGGPGPVLCDRPLPHQDPSSLPGAWELIVMVPPLAAGGLVPALKGRLRVVPGGQANRQILQDDTGDVFAVGMHHGSALTDWMHGGQAEVTRQVREGRKAGYQVERAFTIVGYHDQNRPGEPPWKAWAGRECTPVGFTAHSGRVIAATPDYYPRKKEYVLMLHQEGMRLLDDRGDLNGMTDAQKCQHMKDNGQMFASLGDIGRVTLAGVWAANEGWQNGLPTTQLAADMLNAFKAGAGWWPDVRGMSCPPNTSEEIDPLVEWGQFPATVMTVHGSRTVNSHLIPHYFNYGKDVRPVTGQLVWNTEPIGDGLGVSVGRTDDPEVLTCLCLVSNLGGCPWLFMSGRGVWGSGGPDGPGTIEQHAGFYEVARVQTFLPRDVMRWSIVGHSGVGQPHRFIEASPVEGGPRGDYAIDPNTGRFVMALHATDWAPVKILKTCSQFKITNLVTGLVERDGPIHAGEILHHQYRRARLVTGTLA